MKKLLLRDYFVLWLNKKKLSCEETTIGGYITIINRISKTSLVDKPVVSIQAEDIEEYLASLKGKVKNNTILKDYILLQSVFKNLQRERIIKHNIFLNVEKPKKDDYMIDEDNIYTFDDLQKLYEVLKGTKLELATFLAVMLGLRRSEIAGLRWRDVHFDKNYIFIKNVITTTRCKEIEKTCKTKKSIRKLEMPDFLKKLLLKEYNMQNKIMKNKNIKFNYVLSDYETGNNINPDYITRTFGRILKRHKLKHIRFHDLRHTFASIANEMGATLYDISIALGHSNTSITSSIYIHVFDDTNKKVINVVSDYIVR